MFENRGQEGEVKGHKLDASPVVELVLKLHPEIKHSIKWGNRPKSEKKQRGCKLEIQQSWLGLFTLVIGCILKINEAQHL